MKIDAAAVPRLNAINRQQLSYDAAHFSHPPFTTSPASGAMSELDTPNFKYTNSFNSRLQPTEIAAKMTSGTVLFDKTYGYNPPSTSLMNNGNIYTVTNLKDSTRTQTFTYDLLNRLATAQDAAHWSNVYTYDAWGNLSKKLYGPIAAGEHMDTSADAGNHLLGYSYDAGGNMTSDGVKTYVYDGENRVSSVAGVTYTYDADGRRVKKSSGTNYWYGPSGEALAETDSAGTWTNYVFFGGIRLARNVNGDIKYYITDHLHSTAVFADKSGTVLDDNDFYPWGGVVPGVGQTTSNNAIKFTGKYRDTESGLDYFGARYYANVMGRFMCPDWAAKPVTVPYAEFGDPQSLNLYSYVRNSPVARVDADGHMAVMFTGTGVGYVGGYGVNDGSGDFGSPWGDYVTGYQSTTYTFADGSTITTTQEATWQQGSAGQLEPLSLNLGGTRVTGEYRFGATGDTGPHDNSMDGAVIDATADCKGCAWIQTVARTGSFASSQKTDTPPEPTTPLMQNPDGNAAHFYDRPSQERGNPGTFSAVAMIGTVDRSAQTFHVKGAMAYGYRVDKNGRVSGKAPRLAKPSELRQAIKVVQRDFPGWKVN